MKILPIILSLQLLFSESYGGVGQSKSTESDKDVPKPLVEDESRYECFEEMLTVDECKNACKQSPGIEGEMDMNRRAVSCLGGYCQCGFYMARGAFELIIWKRLDEFQETSSDSIKKKEKKRAEALKKEEEKRVKAAKKEEEKRVKAVKKEEKKLSKETKKACKKGGTRSLTFNPDEPSSSNI